MVYYYVILCNVRISVWYNMLRMLQLYLILQFRDALLGLELLLDAEGDAVAEQCLVGIDRHADLIAHAHHKQPSLGAVQGYLLVWCVCV